MSKIPNLHRRDLLRAGAALTSLGLVELAGANSGKAQRAQIHPVKVLNSAGDLGGIMQNMMQDLGIAKQFGVHFDYQSVASGAQIVAGLVGGSADVCTSSGFSQIFPAIEKNSSLRVIGGCLSLPTLALYSAKPDLKSVEDLPGRTVAVGAVGSLLYIMTVAVLRKHGIDVSKVRFVSVGSSGDTFRAVMAGTVDAGINTADVMDQQQKYGVHPLAGGEMWKELPEFTMQAAYTTQEKIGTERDLLVRTLAAHGKLYRFLSTPASWDAWSRGYDAYFGKQADQVRSRSLWNFIQQRQPFATNLTLDEKRFQYVQELNVSLGVQKKILPYDQVADMSLARDALKLLS